MSEIYLKQLEVIHHVSLTVGELAMKVVTGLTVDGEQLESTRLMHEYEAQAVGESGHELFLPAYQGRNLKTFYKDVFCDRPEADENGANTPETYDCHGALHAILGWNQLVKDCATKAAPVNPEPLPENSLQPRRPYRIGVRSEGRIRVLHSVLAIGGGTLSVLGVNGPLVVAEPQALLHAYQGTSYFRALSPKRPVVGSSE